jgi:hypothetical protein
MMTLETITHIKNPSPPKNTDENIMPCGQDGVNPKLAPFSPTDGKIIF